MASKLTQVDRVAVGVSEALKDFGTGFDVHVSYSTDVQEDETTEDAIDRAYKVVSKKLKAKFKMREKRGLT